MQFYGRCDFEKITVKKTGKQRKIPHEGGYDKRLTLGLDFNISHRSFGSGS